MSKNDFLDFIFPTKNRWHLIENTFESLLAQTDKNFSLLVVDNSDAPGQAELAEKLIAKYKDKINIKYHRTGGLNMLDNWDEGYRLSDARYCYLVTDKIILDPKTVEIFAGGTKALPECNTFLFAAAGKNGKKWEKRRSADLIRQTLDNMDNFFNACWGSELKAFLKREYKDELIKKYGRLIHFIGGDVDQVYLALMNDAQYGTIQYNIIAHKNNSVGSVGRSGEYGGDIYLKYLKDHRLDYNNLYPHAPVNVPNNWNGMYNDLFATAKLCNYPCAAEEINKVNYIIGLYVSLVHFQRLYQINNGDAFLKLHNYVEENNLQFHPKINECFRYYAEHYTATDYRAPKHHVLTPVLEQIFSAKKENGIKTIRIFGIKIQFRKGKKTHE